MTKHHEPLDLVAVAESCLRAGVLSLTPRFPKVFDIQQSLPEYRWECTSLMRLWCRWQLSDFVALEEAVALPYLRDEAKKEVGRPLYHQEDRLLGEAMRDVLTAMQIMRGMKEPEQDDTAERLHVPGRLWA